jgi:hypothetical protein
LRFKSEVSVRPKVQFLTVVAGEKQDARPRTIPRFKNAIGQEDGEVDTRPNDETRPTELDLEIAIFAAP